MAGRLVVDEGRVMLWPETENGKSVPEGEAAAMLLPLRLADGFLRLNVPELPPRVFGRRWPSRPG